MKMYCKKSSVQSVANEVKVRKGSSSSIQGNNIANEIDGLVLPTQRGAPNTVLTASNPSATIQRGKYTGGSVSVVPQNATAVLSAAGGNVTIESGKTLASVTVPASNVRQTVSGEIIPTNNATSISISNLDFRPVGIWVSCSYTSGFLGRPDMIAWACYNNGSSAGYLTDYNYAGKLVTSISASITNTSITISSISGSGATGKFKGGTSGKYVYFVWG